MRAECTIRTLWRRATFTAGLLVCAGAPTWAQVDTTAAAPMDAAGLQINPEGHPIPAFAEFQKDPTKVRPVDTDPSIPGWETLAVGPLQGPNGQRASEFTTGGIVWAYVWVPPDGAAHLLRDPTCSGKFTERFDTPIPDAALWPPPCARAAAAAASADSAANANAAPAGAPAQEPGGVFRAGGEVETASVPAVADTARPSGDDLFDAGAEADLDLAIAEADTPATAESTATNPVPSLAGFVRVKERDMRLDTDASRPGEETLMEAFLGPDSTAIGRLSTGGIVWAYGITPQGSVPESYFLLDADCSGKFAQKLPPTAQFGPPPCAQRADDAAVAPAAAPNPAIALPQYAPADTSAAIFEVGLSAYATSDLPRNAEGVVVVDPARVGTEFGEDTRHLLVSFRWEGAPPGSKVDLHWFHECQPIVVQNHALMGATGHALGGLAQPGTPILPPGGYRVEIFENGKRVTTVPFRIGTAAPANAAHGSPECVAGSH